MEEQEEKEEKEVYRERPDLVEALKGTYIRPFVDKDECNGHKYDAFAEIRSISEVVGETAVKLILRKVYFAMGQNYTVITSDDETPWWIFKKNADDELTVETILANRIKVSHEELVEFARKILKQTLQVMEDMGIHKEEILR